MDRSLAPAAGAAQRASVLRGGYRLIDGRAEPGWDPETNAVHIFARGAMVPEAVAASGALRERGVWASVFAVTSPDLLYRDSREPRPYLERLVSAEEEDVPVVSVLDGHSHGLAFIGARSASRRSLSAWITSVSPARARISTATTASTPAPSPVPR